MTQRSPSTERVKQAEARILAVLEQDLSSIMARCVLRFGLSTTKQDLAALRPATVEPLMRELERGVRLYAPDKAQQCMRALRPALEEIAGKAKPALAAAGAFGQAKEPVSTDAVVIPILSEADIVTARHAGRRMCVALGFSKTEEVKTATVISELARNIVSYAIRGEVSLRRWNDGKRIGIEIEARDQGRGIPNLEEILAGRYRSKTGLGLGITGTRKLAESFEISTELGKGTHVIARMASR